MPSPAWPIPGSFRPAKPEGTPGLAPKVPDSEEDHAPRQGRAKDGEEADLPLELGDLEVLACLRVAEEEAPFPPHDRPLTFTP